MPMPLSPISKRKPAGGDVICVFSNGGFGNIHEKLLAALGGGKP